MWVGIVENKGYVYSISGYRVIYVDVHILKQFQATLALYTTADGKRNKL